MNWSMKKHNKLCWILKHEQNKTFHFILKLHGKFWSQLVLKWNSVFSKRVMGSKKPETVNHTADRVCHKFLCCRSNTQLSTHKLTSLEKLLSFPLHFLEKWDWKLFWPTHFLMISTAKPQKRHSQVSCTLCNSTTVQFWKIYFAIALGGKKQYYQSKFQFEKIHINS